MTVPTIGELKGNTILELFKNGYNALKNAITGKQNKLIAGSNIVITDDNVISAIEGGQAVLDNYYTKTEVDGIVDETTETIEGELEAIANEIPDMTQYYTKSETDSEISDAVANKVNADAVYTKGEVDNLIVNDVICFDAAIAGGTGLNAGKIVVNETLKDGDILACKIALGSSSIYNFVLTYSASGNNNRVTTSVCAVSGGTVGTTYYVSNMNFRLYSNNNAIVIDCQSNRIDISSGTATETNSVLSCVVSYSAIKIYRKKGVE